MAVRQLFTRVLPVAAIGTAAFTITCSAAYGFFPPIPNGSDQVNTPPTISPQVPQVPPPVIPPVVPPFVPPTTHAKPTCMVPPPPTRPNEVPEPATLVVGLVGLSAAAAVAIKKKLGKPTAEAGE